MRSWLARGLAVVSVAAVMVVLEGGPAHAASAYELVAAGPDGAALPGASASATASGDGRFVAFSQQGPDCGSSTAYVRDRQSKDTKSIGLGLIPAITRDGGRVGYVSCSGPEVSVWDGTTSTPITNGQWRHNRASRITDLVISASGGFVAFTADAGASTPSELWVVNTASHAVTAVTVPQGAGAPSAPALSDDGVALLAFVSGGVAYRTSAAKPGQPGQPGQPGPLPQPPGGGVTTVEISGNGQAVAVAAGAAVYLSVNGAAMAQVATGATAPSLSGDGTALAFQKADGSIGVVAANGTADPLATATPGAGGHFAAAAVSDGGRELIFIATPGSAAGGNGSAAQVFALGPGLATAGLDFGSVALGTTSTKAIPFQNTGTVPVTPTVISSVNNAEFAVAVSGTCTVGQAIAVGASCTVQIAFTPSGAGARESTLTIAQQDGKWDGVESQSRLTGVGANGQVTADPTTIDFGTITVGQTASARSFTVTNTGTLTTTIGTILVSGGQAAEFPLAGGTCAGTTLLVGDQCTVSVTFKPGGTGTRTATMEVGGSGGATVGVSLTGAGRAEPPAVVLKPALAVSPTSLDLGAAYVGQAAAPQTVTVRNSGNVANTPIVVLTGAAASDFAITGNGCASRSLAAGATCTVTIGFSPRATGSRTATLSITGTGGSSASVRLAGDGRLNPVLTITPAVVVPGEVVTAVGANFPPATTVALAWDVGSVTVTLTADSTGAFSAPLVTPSGLGSGTRSVVVTAPAEVTAARASVLVQPVVGFQGPGSPAFRNSPSFGG